MCSRSYRWKVATTVSLKCSNKWHAWYKGSAHMAWLGQMQPPRYSGTVLSMGLHGWQRPPAAGNLWPAPSSKMGEKSSDAPLQHRLEAPRSDGDKLIIVAWGDC